MEAVEGHFFGDPTIERSSTRCYGNDEAMVQPSSPARSTSPTTSPTLSKTLEGVENIAINGFGRLLHELRVELRRPGEGASDHVRHACGDEETNHPAIHDLAVRQAVAHAMDKQEMAEVVFQGAAVPAEVHPPDKGYWHLDIPAEEEYEFDLEQANQDPR